MTMPCAGRIQPTPATADLWRKVRIARRILFMTQRADIRRFARAYIGKKSAEIRRCAQ